jgi:hypothetical protein
MERHIEQRKLFDSSEENMTNSMPLCMLSEIELSILIHLILPNNNSLYKKNHSKNAYKESGFIIQLKTNLYNSCTSP